MISNFWEGRKQKCRVSAWSCHHKPCGSRWLRQDGIARSDEKVDIADNVGHRLRKQACSSESCAAWNQHQRASAGHEKVVHSPCISGGSMNSRQKGFVAPGYTLTSGLPTAPSTALVLSVVYLCSALPYDELTPRSSKLGCLAASSMAKTSWSTNQQ